MTADTDARDEALELIKQAQAATGRLADPGEAAQLAPRLAKAIADAPALQTSARGAVVERRRALQKLHAVCERILATGRTP